MIEGAKCVGLQYYPAKVIDILISQLDRVQYSDEYKMRFVLNTEANLKIIMERFKGVAWINYKFFYKNKPIHTYGGADENLTL